MNKRYARTCLVPVSLVLALGACSGGSDGDVAISAFTATPLMVASGGTTNLAWTTTNATQITITAEPGGELVNTTDATGSATSAALTGDTKFTLTAAGPGGPVSRSVMVTVMANNNMPMITAFSASPATIAPGASSTLSWTTMNADSVTITAGGNTLVDAGPATGTQVVMPADTTSYELVATGAGGTAMQTVTVTVDPNPVVNSFMARPTTIDPGDSSTLSWDVANADNVTVTDSNGTEVYNDSGLMANVMVSPAATETYTLVATNPNGTAMGTAMVTVNPPQGPAINAFTANPTTINLGEETTLSWDVSNATTITISDGAATTTTSTDLMGMIALRPLTTTTYTLTASDGSNPDVPAMVTVTVNAASPAILDFSATPNPVGIGATTVVSFDVVGADSVRVLRNATEIYTGTMGTDMLTETINTATTAYLLEATNTTGTSMQMLVVNGHAAPAINAFTVAPGTFQGTVTATVSFDVSDTFALELYIDGALDSSFPGVGTPTTAIDATGTYAVSVSASTTFRLVATSAGGMAEQTVTISQTVGKTEPNDDAANAFPYPVGGNVVTGEITPEDQDWYAITVPAGHSIRAETSDGQGGCPFDTTLTLTSTDGVTTLAFNDDKDGANDRCSLIDPAAPATSGAANLAAGTYYVVVEPFSTQTGIYVLDVQVIAPACGNGIVDGNDICDDGNSVAGDGCDALCMLEVTNTYASPGAAMTFTASIATVGQFYTYEITATAPSYIAAETFSNAATQSCSIDTEIFLLDSTGAVLGSDDFDGVNSCSATRPGVDAWARLDVGTYYLQVTEDDNNALAYFELVLEGIPADVCGNGIIDGTAEQCDDGNTTANDGCSATCDLEAVGTFVATGGTTQTFATNALAVGQVDTFAVQVPAGNDVYLYVETFEDAQAGTCDTIDTVLRLLDASGTQLGTNDEGGVNSCSRIAPTVAYARLTAGTNYFVTVEDYLLNTAIANYDVVFAATTADICGNGFIDGTNEACDDGNTTPGDGCDATCQVEVQPAFVATPGATQTYTGGLAVGQVATYDVTVPAGNDVYLYAETFEDAATMTCPNIDTVIRLLDSGGTEIGTDDQDGVGSCSLMTPVTDAFMRLAPGTYQVTVEDWLVNTAIPSYDLVLTAAATDICGNGVLEMGENCDDGNTVGGDSCPANCMFGTTVSGSSTPNVAIPDVDPLGVSDMITIPATPACTVQNVSVDVDITHTYRGDLIIDLTSPSGTTVRLKDSAFDSVDDVIGNYPSTLTPAGNLGDFLGDNGNGAWTLFIEDTFTGDTGTLNSWGLTVACQ